MIISVGNNCSLKVFPHIPSKVNYHPSVHRKFLLKCEGVDSDSNIVILPSYMDGDIAINCKGKQSKRFKVLFAANKSDLITYTELYDEEIDVCPVYCMDFKPLHFTLPNKDIQWVVFTSKRAFMFFLRGGNIKYLCDKKIGAVGRKTAQLIESYGLKVDFTPKDFVSSELIKTINKNALVVTARVHSNVYEEVGLDIVEAYENILPEESKLFKYDGEFDYGLFSSPSAFVNTLKIHGEELTKKIKQIVAIGPTTRKTIESYGIECIMPTRFTIEGMFNLIRGVYGNGGA